MNAQEIAQQHWDEDRDGCRAKFRHPSAYTAYVASMVSVGRGGELTGGTHTRTAPVARIGNGRRRGGRPRPKGQTPWSQMLVNAMSFDDMTDRDIERLCREQAEKADRVLREIENPTEDDDDDVECLDDEDKFLGTPFQAVGLRGGR